MPNDQIALFHFVELLYIWIVGRFSEEYFDFYKMITREEVGKIFREFYPALRIYARRYVSDAHIAEDIVQDVFINLWKLRDTFAPDTSMKSYLFTAVYHRCLNHIKHEKIKAGYSQEHSDPNEEFRQFYSETLSTYEESLLQSEFSDKIKHGIEDLPDQCRRVFLLSRKFGMKNREIADYLQISLKVVEKQITKALSNLRDQLR